MKTNVKKIILVTMVILSFLNLKAGEEDDQTIITFSAPEQLNIYTKADNNIIELRMYNLLNPYQFSKTLHVVQCNEANTDCLYSVLNSDLIVGDVYRISMIFDNSSESITIQYIHK